MSCPIGRNGLDVFNGFLDFFQLIARRVLIVGVAGKPELGVMDLHRRVHQIAEAREVPCALGLIGTPRSRAQIDQRPCCAGDPDQAERRRMPLSTFLAWRPLLPTPCACETFTRRQHCGFL